MMTEKLMQQAVAHHQAGRLQEAGEIYQRILQTQPNHPEANHNLGALAVTMEQPAAGLPYFMAALEADPARGQFWLSYIDALVQADERDLAREVLALARQQGLEGDEVEALAERLEEVTHPAQPAQDEHQLPAGVTPSAHLANKPSPQETHALVGLFNAGQYSKAESVAREMTVRFPLDGLGWNVLGAVFRQKGNNTEALAAMQKAAALSPLDVYAHSNLGIMLSDMGRMEEAEISLRLALKLKPDFAEAHCNLGTVFQEMGRMDEAEASHRRAIQIQPDFAEAHYNLGNALKAAGRLNEAAASFRRTLEIKPDHARARSNLGITLNDLGRQNEAEANLRQALKTTPDDANTYSNLGNALQGQGRLDEAEASFRRALQINPNLAEAHNNLGIILQDLGRLKEAEASFRQALAIKPDYDKAHSNLLFLLNYNPANAPSIGFSEAQLYGQRVGSKVTARFSAWSCDSQTERMRIGMVSGDLRNHPVGYFLENLLAHLDPAAFELVAYPTDHREDELTARIKPRFHAWRPLFGLGDEAAARLIHDDGVHVLMDLSGHSRYNRLPVFAWKPAPVQVSWLGYFATTGVPEIDYLIADPWTLPETEEVYFTEKIWRLPETRLCFTPPEIDLEISSLPALTNGFVTFGCFNNLTKMNDAVVEVWSRILASVPDSHLFLKSKQLMDTSVRQHTIKRFAAQGIDVSRLVLEGHESRANYLAAYHRVDISLDPFPYPGGTTTVESLWMGVPVLNLAGQSFLSRQGMGFLMNAGLPEWVAADADDYVKRATIHAGDLPRLAELRMGLRKQVTTSPIMDGQRFAGHFESALRDMWRTWLETHPGR